MADSIPMFLAGLIFSGRQWLPWAGAGFVLALLLVVWTYRQGGANRGVKTLCLSLKLLGFALLLACLLEPLWVMERAKPGANLFAVVADNSEGMKIKDRGTQQSRGEILKTILTRNDTKWQDALDENFQVRRYFFDTRLQGTRDFSELAFDGRASSIGQAIKGLGERYKGQALAGILMFTDGNATDIGDDLAVLTGLPPIYPVVSGEDLPVKDVAIAKVSSTQTAFEDAPVSIQVDVTSIGYLGQRIVAELLDTSASSTNKSMRATNNAAATKARVLATQTQRSQADPETLSFRFNVRPEKPGLNFIRLRVYAMGEEEQFTAPEKSVEATLANNSRVLAVDRGRGPYNLLYVSGRPNWEFKFLNRALDEDDQMRMSALIRVAKREPKFDFRGRQGESSNPLFRGFKDQTQEEVERYDQPVVIRLNTRDKDELRGGFPKTAEELYGYQAIIMDDLEADFFTADQAALVQKFVSERGGGLLMLGGMESFAHGKYQKTPIGDMLPVYLDRPPEGKPPEKFRLSLTREGWLQPWARLRNNESDERARIEGMPPFLVVNTLKDIKPGASVIARVADPSGKDYPALVVQQFGRGRTAALTIGDFWHWGLKDKELHKDMDKAWRQLARWLVSDVPGRLDFQARPIAGDPNGAVLLQVRTRDKKFQALDGATVSFTVGMAAAAQEAPLIKPGATNAPVAQLPPQQQIKLQAEPSANEAGLYEATFVPRQAGGYLAAALVTDASGVEVGKAEAGWTADPAAEEFKSLRPNRALLEAIARKTGGEIVMAGKLLEFAKKLPTRNAPVMENWTNPVWNTPLVFGFALLCFVTEWGVRRWKGLA